jgi:hypothetical protein
MYGTDDGDRRQREAATAGICPRPSKLAVNKARAKGATTAASMPFIAYSHRSGWAAVGALEVVASTARRADPARLGPSVTTVAAFSLGP